MLKSIKFLSVLLAIVLIFTAIPIGAFAAQNSDYNDTNNRITSVASLTAPNMTEMKWAYPLNASVMAGGAYYAGQSVIADGYLYATGGGKLHKVDIETGVGITLNDNAGSTVSYYDYICYADGILIISTQDKLSAYGTDGTLLAEVSGTYGYYHPIQYHDGYVICNGFIYKLDRSDNTVTFAQVGESSIGGDVFNWSNGAFVNGLFYVASKTTVYAVDYKNNTVVDSYVFDENRTATNNVQGGICYDVETGRLFWGTYTYNSYIHSVAVGEDGFVKNSYIAEDAGQKSVATPIVYNGRVYLAGQQGRICVHNASDLSKVYDYVTLGGGKVQGNPILSYAEGKVRIYAQCSNGHLYMFTDNGDYGEAVKLAETKNYTKVTYPYAGFEQYTMDENGNIYCYNESGYLFCFGVSACEKPVIAADLSTDRVKYGVGEQTLPLKVEATVSEGDLSYQWQLSADGDNFSDIEGAVSDSYTPSSETAGTTYYRCVITNTVGENTACETSKSAFVLVKNLSNSTKLNVMVGKSNSQTSGVTQAVMKDGVLYVENRTDVVKNIFLGVEDEGEVTDFEVIYGAGTTEPKKYSVSGDVYSSRYYKNPYTLPIVAKATVRAEDGVTESEQFIVVSAESSEKYIVKVSLTSDSEYFEDGINFTQAEQKVTLTVTEEERVGTGEVYPPQWEWTSSDTKVATVTDGVVKCIGGGNAVITASYQGVSASVNVSSVAPIHSLHTYVEGNCNVCGQTEPNAVSVTFTVIDKENNVAVSKDGITEMYKTKLSVGDVDCDGEVTLKDAFVKVHTEHHENGADGFVAEDSSYGPFITKLWGEQTSNVAYTVNDKTAFSLLTALAADDSILTYFYKDVENYSDVYTYIEGNERITAGIGTEFVLKGMSSSGDVIPSGATVTVVDSEGTEVSHTTVGSDGKFTVSIETAGEYTLQAGGNASYTGQAWDNATGTYVPKEFNSAPVVLSRFKVTVIPYVEKTVYLSVATKNGDFGVTKDGEEMWRFPVTVTDNPDNPDGVVTIFEMLVSAHKQYHPDGESALGFEKSYYGTFITKLWGENNGGNCQYYFNDVEMTGSGIKTGTNLREWEDKTLDTVVETGDSFYIYSLQATDYNHADLYTYFDPVSESATVGNAKVFTLKSVSGYGDNKMETSLVTVYDSEGDKVAETTVAADGTFEITFTKKGTYTVDVRTNGANYISPARLIVHVNGGGSVSSQSTVYISVKDPKGKTYLAKTEYVMENGETAFSLLEKTGLEVVATTEYQYSGVYIESIEGLGEQDQGAASGWMYSVNGQYPEYSSSLYLLSDGDYVQWIYTRELGDDIGGGRGSSFVQKETQEESVTYTDVSEDAYYAEAVKYVTDKKLFGGISETQFAPDATMTREMLVTVLWRLENQPSVDFHLEFEDVKEDSWYYDAVNWAVSENIVFGIGENCFGTNTDITREQLATILLRYISSKEDVDTGEMNFDSFTDADEVSPYATEAIAWAVGNGILNGDGNKLLPVASATRAQVAIMIMRFCEVFCK